VRDGRITKCYIVECITCLAEEVAWEDSGLVTKKRAVEVFKDHGWVYKRGVWHCANCKKKDRSR